MNEPTDFMAYSKSPGIAALSAALAKAQGEIKNPAFDKANPHFRNRYASLASCLDAVRVPLSKNGLAIMQVITTPAPDWVTVTTILTHSSGEWISADFGAKAQAQIQQVGATVTYLRRYALSSVLGIVGDDDDDGESDQQSKSQRPPDAPREPAKEPTLTTAEAKSLMKALAAKGLSLGDLSDAMVNAGLKPPADVTSWPVAWKPRVKSWLDNQVAREKPKAPEEGAGDE